MLALVTLLLSADATASLFDVRFDELGAVWAGLAGQLMGTHLTAISPNSFLFLYSALILMAVVLGGMGSVPGVIIGALFVSLAPEFLREFAEWRFLLFGVLLVVTMIFRPTGIWPATAILPWSKDKHVDEDADEVEQDAAPESRDEAELNEGEDTGGDLLARREGENR